MRLHATARAAFPRAQPALACPLSPSPPAPLAACFSYVLELLKKDLKPRDIMTLAAFENAIVLIMATGGSTNAGDSSRQQRQRTACRQQEGPVAVAAGGGGPLALRQRPLWRNNARLRAAPTLLLTAPPPPSAVLHLIAMARSCGLELTLDDFQRVSDRVPFIADLKPSGKYVMEDVHLVSGRGGGRAGGLAVLQAGGLVHAPRAAATSAPPGFPSLLLPTRDVPSPLPSHHLHPPPLPAGRRHPRRA